MSSSDQNSPVVFDFYKRKEKIKDEMEIELNVGKNDLDKVYASKKIQIVILDLDTKAMGALSSLLKPRYEVHCCTSPSSALRLLSTKKIALIISEQAFPNLSILGVDFLKQAKKIAPFTTRILLAGQLDFGKAKYSLEKGDVFKLVKRPFDNNRILGLIDDAVESYLEKSGGLAAAAAKMQQLSPNITKQIELTKTVSPSSNPVVIQCEDNAFFDEVKENYTDKALFIHAKSKEETIKTLETTVVKTLVYCFNDSSLREEKEILFLEQIKNELPHLTIITIMSKDRMNYQQIMNLLTNKIIFNYLPFNTKLEKLYQQLSAAIEMSNRLYTGPVYLVWPPLERVEPKAEEETISEALKDVSLKVKEGVLSGLETVRGFFKKKD